MTGTPKTYLHIGLPKTGTTFLQGMLTANSEELSAQGISYPGRSADHFLAAQDVLDHDFVGHQDDRAHGAWKALLQQLPPPTQSAIISHELFSLASEEQVKTIVSSLRAQEVQVVVTARDLLRQLPAVWQENLKNGKTKTLAEFVEHVKSTDGEEQARGFWAFQDLGVIAGRWARELGEENVTIVTVPPSGTGQEQLWERFMDALSISLPHPVIPQRRKNSSLGADQAEFLRRVNQQVDGFLTWPQYRDHVKQTLVSKVLARGDQVSPIVLAPLDAEWAVHRSQQMVRELHQHDYRVVGDLNELISQSPKATSSQRDVIEESAIVDVGVDAISGLLRHINRTKQKGRKAS